MPINQDDSKVLAAIFGEDKANEISGAIPEELSLGLRLNGKILTIEEQKQIKEEAINQGKELRSKEFAKSLGLTLEAGEKDPDIIAEKLKTGISVVLEEKYKNQTPDEATIALAKKASEFEDKNKKLLETLGLKEKEAGEWQKKYEEKEFLAKEEKFNNDILSVLPDKMTLSKTDALLVIRHAIKEETDENGITTYIVDGERQLDSLSNPEPLKNVIPLIVEKRGWIKTAGMGGSDRKQEGTSIKGMAAEAAMKKITDAGINPASAEGLKLFKEYTSK